MNVVIGITGELQHGKGTTADILDLIASEHGLLSSRPFLAEPLKQFLAEQFGVRQPFYGTGAEKNTPMAGVYWRDFAPNLIAIAKARNICFDVNASPTGRNLMQLFGTEVIREGWHPKAWLMIARSRCLKDRARGVNMIIVDDIRFPNEADRSTVPLTHLIRVVNPHKPKPPVAHASEIQAIDPAHIDATIMNDTTISDLEVKVRDWAHKALGLPTR